MAEIRSIDEIGKKWATVTPQRSADYEAGVRSPRRDWKQAALASNDSWKAGVQAAVTKDAFAKGVTKSGSSRWSEGSVDKGVPRWGPGVQLAEGAYVKGFGPYATAIKGLTLPARYARRDPRNLQRVTAVVNAMIKVKEAQG